MAYLYHIKLPGMSLHEGYIGISKCYETRWKQHEHAAHNLMSPYVVHQKMREHEGEYVKEVIFEGTVQEVFDKEEELRPEWMMGWNMAKGGGAAGSGWIQPDSWISNELWHPVHGERKLSSEYNVTDLIRDVFPDAKRPDKGTESSSFSQLLRGLKSDFKGWELRDAQLAKHVQTWLESPWDSSYFKSSSEVVLVYKPHAKDFVEKCFTQSHANTGWLYQLVKGIKKSVNGWSLATQEEYEANPGRVFGTPEEDDCETTTYTYTDGVTEESSTLVKEQEAEHGTSPTENTPCMSVGCDVTSTKGVWGSVKSWIGTLLNRKRWIERSI